MRQIYSFTWLILMTGCPVLLNSLQVLHLDVPGVVEEGEKAIFTCSYRLTKGEFIDSVKWYLNSTEIYRIVPGLITHRVVQFPVDGLTLDLSQSGLLSTATHQLVITKVNRQIQGRYICQVTEGRPPFRTDQMGADLIVSVLPKASPELHLPAGEVQAGEQANVSCRVPPTSPRPNITWSTNGRKLWESDGCNDSIWPETGEEGCAGSMTVLTSSSHADKLRVTCWVEIFPIYRERVSGTVKLIRADQPILGVPLRSFAAERSFATWWTILVTQPLLQTANGFRI